MENRIKYSCHKCFRFLFDDDRRMILIRNFKKKNSVLICLPERAGELREKTDKKTERNKIHLIFIVAGYILYNTRCVCALLVPAKHYDITHKKQKRIGTYGNFQF